MSVKDPLGLKRKKYRRKKSEYFEPQWKSDIEHYELEFVIKTATIRFNRKATYVIKFILNESFTNQYDGVMIKVDDGEYTENHSYAFEPFVPEEIGVRFPFDHSVSFILPKGYCKNDGHHDVHVRLEAWEAAVNGKGLIRLMGQSIYPVYPRPAKPHITLNPKKGRPMLKDHVVLPLLRTPNTDQKIMHCGDLAFSVTMSHRGGLGGSLSVMRASSATGTQLGDETDRTGGVTTWMSGNSPMPPLHLGELDNQGKMLEGTTSFDGEKKPSQARNWSTVNQQDLETSLEASEKEEDLLHVGSLLEAKKNKSMQFKSLHDVKNLLPEALKKRTSSGTSALSQLSHTAHPGTEKIDVLVHSVCSLPARSTDDNLPRAFIAASTTMGFLQNEIQSFTHISKNLGPCGTYGEMCTVEFDGVTIDNEALVLAVIDKDTLEVMAFYSIPVIFLQPYQEYNLELRLPRRHGVNCRLYASLMRKLPQIPHEQMDNTYGVEAMIQNFETTLSGSLGAMICVVRVVSDYTNLWHALTTSRSHPMIGVNPSRITFPLPKIGKFIESEKKAIGNAQVSLPSESSAQPKWNFPYLFATSRDKATLFTPGAALILEYYPFTLQTNESGWYLANPVGFSVIPMDSKMFESMSNSGSSNGVKIQGLPVFGNILKNTQGKIPTVSVALRLLSSNVTNGLAGQTRAIFESLPIIDIHPFLHEMKVNCKEIGYKYTSPCLKSSQKQQSTDESQQTQTGGQLGRPVFHLIPKVNADDNLDELIQEYRMKVLTEAIPRPALKLQLEEGELPPPDALQSVLPEYRYLLEGGRGARNQHASSHILRQLGDDPSRFGGGRNIGDDLGRFGGGRNVGQVDARRLAPAPNESPLQTFPQMASNLSGTNLVSMNGVPGYGPLGGIPVHGDAMAVAELDQYRRAVRRMGEDILALRREIANSSTENTRLANQLAHYDDLTKTVLSTQVIEGLSKAELADRYVASRQQLIQQEEQLQQYKQRLQKLQNEIIRHNDREVESTKIRQAHAAQQALIQRLQEKGARYDKLAETVRHQELVIERMERVLTTRLKALPDGDNLDVNNVQRDAYDSVVEENSQLRRQIEELRIINEATGQAQTEVDAERLQMMQAMDRMEARIVALEQELDDRGREWGRERAELVIKLNEQHRGFSPTKNLSPPRRSPVGSPVGVSSSFKRVTIAESGAAPPTAFPSLSALHGKTSIGRGATLLGRAKAW